MTLLHFMIAVHCFQFQNRTMSSFSEWSLLMDKCGSWCQVWRVFHLFSNNHLSCCVNIKHRFNIIGVPSFLRTFSFILPSFPMVFFPITKRFLNNFFSNFTGFYLWPVFILILALKDYLKMHSQVWDSFWQLKAF